MNQESMPLNVATIRLSGSDGRMDDVVRDLKLNVVSRAKAGDPRKRGGIHALSTLNCPIADAATPGVLINQVREFLVECIKHGAGLFGDGVDAELSIGISVGDPIQFVASVNLTPSDIRDLATLGISLDFTAYPTSSEAPGTPFLK
jgi:hypothetical protein